ncbi:MAG: hypothetical protein ACI9GW_003713, partial [Halieaceae bacterium]
MASFEEDFYLENPSRWQAIKRDVRLLCTLFGYAILWLTKGVQVRRAYNRAGKTG